MIVRIWHGWTEVDDEEAYARHATDRVFPSLTSIRGYRGALLLRRRHGSEVEFIVQTMWDSLDAVRGFAGDVVDRAVVEHAAEKVLSRFDKIVRHYEILAAAELRLPKASL